MLLRLLPSFPPVDQLVQDRVAQDRAQRHRQHHVRQGAGDARPDTARRAACGARRAGRRACRVKGLHHLQVRREFRDLGDQARALADQPEGCQHLKPGDHLVNVPFLADPLQRPGQVLHRLPDGPHDAVVALLQLLSGLVQLFRRALDRRHNPVEEGVDVLFQLFQVRVVPAVQVLDQVVQDRLRPAYQVQAQPPHVGRLKAVQERPPGFVQKVDPLGQAAHLADLLFRHPQPFKVSQVIPDRAPVVQQVHHLRGPLLAEDLARRVQPAFVVHRGQAVHHGHGVFPLVAVKLAAYLRRLGDLLLVAHVDPGHRVVQVFEAVVGAFHRVGPFLDRGGVRVPEARQVHPAVRPSGQVHHVGPYLGYGAPHRVHHAPEKVFDSGAHGLSGVRDLPDTVGKALRCHGTHLGVPFRLLEAFPQSVQVVLHAGQRGPGVVQLLLPLLDLVLVVAVLLPDLFQGLRVGLNDLLLLLDALLQVLPPRLGLLLLRGVPPQLRGLRLQLAPQGLQVTLRFFDRRAVFLLALQRDLLLDLFRHVPSLPFPVTQKSPDPDHAM